MGRRGALSRQPVAARIEPSLSAAGLWPVNEIFATVQGEGRWTGTPAVFVRLQGCDVGCPWCDTKHSWDRLAADRCEIDAGPRESATSWAELTTEALLGRVREQAGVAIRHAVITGGEPLMHDLAPLLPGLKAIGLTRMQVETSGTYGLGGLAGVSSGIWITVSPKIGMPGGRVIDPTTVAAAHEIKWLVGKGDDIERLDAFLSSHAVRPDCEIRLQPLSMSKRATDLAFEAALARGWSVSIQTHRLMNIP